MAAAAATIRCCRIIPLSSKRSCCCCYCCSDGGGLGLLHLREGERERVRPRARARLSYLMASTTTTTTSSSNFNFIFCSSRARRGVHNVLRSSLDAKSKSNTPQLQLATPNFSQQEDDCESPPEGPVSVTGGVVALGKFDALHIGHRELAMQASNAGNPFLLSFVGMAEVLGWEWRAPIVAKCDRKRVLSSWAPYCGSVAPAEFHVEFSSVRHLSPRQFVEKLAKELGVCGVVAGENYRFGYKAAGDASELVKLCEEYGMEAYIVSSVMDKNQSTRVKIPLGMKEKGQVSSTRVRLALADGDIEYVSELLGRSHRLVLALSEVEGFIQRGNRMSAPKSCLLNLPPKDGYYETCNYLIDDNLAVSCTTMIDDTHIHVESNQQIPFQDCSLISIEFGWA